MVDFSIEEFVYISVAFLEVSAKRGILWEWVCAWFDMEVVVVILLCVVVVLSDVVEGWVVKRVVSVVYCFLFFCWLWVPLNPWVVMANEIGVFESWINFFCRWCGVVSWA